MAYRQTKEKETLVADYVVCIYVFLQTRDLENKRIIFTFDNDKTNQKFPKCVEGLHPTGTLLLVRCRQTSGRTSGSCGLWARLATRISPFAFIQQHMYLCINCY
jgi:hypothetical protein